jgi:hypothetical protein
MNTYEWVISNNVIFMLKYDVLEHEWSRAIFDMIMKVKNNLFMIWHYHLFLFTYMIYKILMSQRIWIILILPAGPQALLLVVNAMWINLFIFPLFKDFKRVEYWYQNTYSFQTLTWVTKERRKKWDSVIKKSSLKLEKSEI